MHDPPGSEEAKRDIIQRVGRWLRMAREAANVTVPEFAAALRIQPNLLSRIELGERPIPIHVLFEAGRKLRTRWDYLLSGDLSSVDVSLRLRLWAAFREQLLPYQTEFLANALDADLARYRPDPAQPVRQTIPRRRKGDTNQTPA